MNLDRLLTWGPTFLVILLFGCQLLLTKKIRAINRFWFKMLPFNWMLIYITFIGMVVLDFSGYHQYALAIIALGIAIMGLLEEFPRLIRDSTDDLLALQSESPGRKEE